jgi:DNA-binding protein HU-beta
MMMTRSPQMMAAQGWAATVPRHPIINSNGVGRLSREESFPVIAVRLTEFNQLSGDTQMKPSKSRMTQAQVIAHMSEKFNLKRSQTKELFDHLAELASTEVKESGEFQLPGFGKLVLAERKARQGRNPATGEMIEIPARTAL